MTQATRWTRFAHRAIGISAGAAVLAAAFSFVHKRPDDVTLRLATADLRSRAAEAALVARAWDEHRATGSFTRMQAMQLSHIVSTSRREAEQAPTDVTGDVTAAADTLLLALRDLEQLPAPEEASPRSATLDALSDSLHAIERNLSARD